MATYVSAPISTVVAKYFSRRKIVEQKLLRKMEEQKERDFVPLHSFAHSTSFVLLVRMH